MRNCFRMARAASQLPDPYPFVYVQGSAHVKRPRKVFVDLAIAVGQNFETVDSFMLEHPA